MKRIFYLIATSLLVMTGTWSCGFDRGQGVEYLPVKLLWDDDWGFVDGKGRLWLDDRFAGTATACVNGYFSVRDSAGNVTVYRGSSEPTAVTGLSGLADAGYMSEGLMPVVTSAGELRAVDGFGRVRFALSALAGRKIVRCSVMFRCGLLSVCNDLGNWGAVDTEGRVVIAPKYSSELVFVGGYARAVETDGFGVNETYRNSIVDSHGRVTYKFPADMFPLEVSFHGGRMAFSQGDRYGLVTPGAEVTLLPSEVKGVYDFNDTYIIYIGANGCRGLMDLKGDVALRARYATLEFGSKGQLLASNAQHYFLIDYAGRVTAKFADADEVVYVGNRRDADLRSDFAYAVRRGSLWSLCDRTGEPAGFEEFAVMDLDIFFGAKELWVDKTPAVGAEIVADEAATTVDSVTVDSTLMTVDSIIALP